MTYSFAAVHPAEQRSQKALPQPSVDGEAVRAELIAAGVLRRRGFHLVNLDGRLRAPVVRIDDDGVRSAAREIFASTPKRKLGRVIAQCDAPIAARLRELAERHGVQLA